MIYLRFLTEKWSIESRVIRFGTRWWVSHVEFMRTTVIDGKEEATDTLGSRLDGGVKLRPYNYCKPTREEWWTHPGIIDAYRACTDIIGSPYDWSDIAGFVFARNWHKDGHFICSAAVDYAFKKTSTPMTNNWIPYWRVSPRDLLLADDLEFVKRVV